MRVCFIGHQGTKEGAGFFMLDQIDYLRQKGVTIFAILPGDGALADALTERRIEFAIVPNDWWIKPHWLGRDEDHGRAVVAAHKMADFFRRWAIDVVYTETSVAPAGAFAAAFAGLPHIWHLHEFAYNATGIQMALPRESWARVIDLTSNYVFFNSKAVGADWEGLFPAEKTRVVYNWTAQTFDDGAVDTSDSVARALLNSESTFVATIVASIHPLKRQIDAVQAVGNLLREGVDVALLVVGPVVDQAYHATLTDLVQQNRWENRIRFLGFSDHPHRVMRESGVMLVCSSSEAFGRVTVESMAQGTPVIGSNYGGTAEIIDAGVDGLLFPLGDVPELTNTLRKVVTDSRLRERLSEAARSKARRFQGAESSMPPVLRTIEELVGAKNPSWPFGSLVGSGLNGGILSQQRARGLADRARRVALKLLGR
jgi:glycosyltransferase involved in cell wall biosynthesis